MPIAEVLSDRKYPGIMWRFRLLPDGELSDMVNLSRAKDAAVCRALARLNTQETTLLAPRIEQTEGAAGVVS